MPRPSWHLFNRSSVMEPERAQTWDLVNGFLQKLAGVTEAAPQLRLLLEMVQRSTEADLAFVTSLESGQPVEYCGSPRPSAEQCQSLLSFLLRQTPGVDGHMLCSQGLDQCGLDPAPNSVALVRLSRSRQTWLVAVSFSAGHTFSLDHIQFMQLARRLLQQQRQHLYTLDQLRESVFGLVRCLTTTLDARDPYTCGHSERVARMAVCLGRQMRLSESELNNLYLGGLLHDIGKVGIRDEVLSKPGPLTPEERAAMQRHTVIGDAIMAHVKHLSHLRPLVRNHHERFDGSGYPDRLAGVGIPLMARVLAVADTCDALLSNRPYRHSLAHDEVESVLQQGAGRQWDPFIVQHFLDCRNELYAIHERGLGESVQRAVEQAIQQGMGEPSAPASLAAFTAADY